MFERWLEPLKPRPGYVHASESYRPIMDTTAVEVYRHSVPTVKKDCTCGAHHPKRALHVAGQMKFSRN